MATCVMCKGELDEKVGIYLDERYIRRHRVEADGPRFLHSRQPLHYAHPACVEHPNDLGEKEYRKWATSMLAKQGNEIRNLRRDLGRIEHALMALPEEMTATFRDELEHERRNRGDATGDER